MNIVTPDPQSPHQPKSNDDVWLPSSCSLCYGSCSIMAHRVDGVVTKIEGNPNSIVGKGRLCGKGISGIMVHYDPNRLTKPLKRTNLERGIGVDPKFKEISWEEALTEVADNLKKIRADDPRKLVVQRTTSVTPSRVPMTAFGVGFGTPNISTAGGGLHCGNGAHLISGVMHASWSVMPDFGLCNYAIFFGASKGHSAGHASCSNMGLAADARLRGMKMVVVDPMCNFAAAKSSEWVPVRVGGDAGLALAMCNVIVNELNIFDAPYLKAKTNGAYLIGPDKKFARDPETGKPRVWDETTGKAVCFDDTESDNMALEGSFKVDGIECTTAFTLLREHLKTYTPEKGEEISTVPADNIRRLATEFATESKVGSTIVIDGVEVPYRPAAAIAFRGSQGHMNSVYNFLAIDLLNQLVGSADMAGGCLGFNPACHGYPGTGRLRYVPKPDKDGLMVTGMWMTYHDPYPMNDPVLPQSIGLQSVFPMSMTSPYMDSSDQEELWEKLELPYRPEMLINFGSNLLMSIGNREAVEASLKKYKFLVSIDLFRTETSDMCDIVLPDSGYLSMTDSRSNFPFIFSLPAGMGEWCWPIRQPIVEPTGEQRPFSDILIELAERAGFTGDFNMGMNTYLDLNPPYRLQPDRRYTYEEICDNDLKDKFGEDKGLDWFKENGVIKWKKKPEEVYWRHFENVRVSIYWEWMTDMYEKSSAILEPRGLSIPKEYYEPLPDFLPCMSHKCDMEGYDFYSFYYRDIVHTNSFTMENAWLDEAAQMDPFSYNIAINEDAAHARGFETGDEVWVETETGLRVDGRLRLTQAIHPEGLGIAALCGHWGEGMPVAKDKGVFYNGLLELDWQHASPVNMNLDLCAKVKVTRKN